MNRIAIYDMDKTITRRPTFTPFLLHAALRRNPARLLFLPAVTGAVILYGLRLIDRARLKEINHALLVGNAMSPADSRKLAASFAERTMRTNMLGEARKRIAADRADGYRLVLATASYEFYAGDIGRVAGFDDVIGTATQVDTAGATLARIAGENCYGAAKLRMIEGWLARAGLSRTDCHIRFYSDHVSDAPTLDWADEAFAVNAHRPLAALARARSWTLLDWR